MLRYVRRGLNFTFHDRDLMELNIFASQFKTHYSLGHLIENINFVSARTLIYFKKT